MRIRGGWMLLAAGLLPGAREVGAQEAPAATAAAFFAALERSEWRAAASHVDPRTHARHQRIEVSMLLNWAEQRERIRVLAREGGSYAIVASDTVDTAALRKYGSTPVRGYRETPTLAQLAALSPAEFMARYLETGGELLRERRRIVGEVVENDSVAHVLYRSDDPHVQYEDPFYVQVLNLRKSGGRWYVRLNIDLTAGMELLRMHQDELLPGFPARGKQARPSGVRGSPGGKP